MATDEGDDDRDDDGDNDGADDGDDDDVDDCGAREDVGKEDVTNNTITSEQDDTLEVHATLSDGANDTVHEHSTSLCHTILLRQS